jgi:hypothetical protein
MKNNLRTIGMAVIGTLILSSVALAQADKPTHQPQKSRHIKMVKVENGKKTEIDTVLKGNQPFVWQGDTINPEKHLRGIHPSPAGFDKARRMHEGKRKVIIREDLVGEPINSMMWKQKGGNEMEIITENIDSTGTKIIMRKRMKDGHPNNQMYFIHHGNDGINPPPPPFLPSKQMKIMKMKPSGQFINLNDPNVISYKKKDIGKDREKIEITRFKPKNKQVMSFEFDENMPMPPMPPQIDNLQFNGQKMMITEKDTIVDGKKSKTVRVEVEKEK